MLNKYGNKGVYFFLFVINLEKIVFFKDFKLFYSNIKTLINKGRKIKVK